jgi:translation initiation factor IF-2
MPAGILTTHNPFIPVQVGDAFVAGETHGRVRALIASDGKTRLQQAGPSTPVSIIGFADGVPAAGDLLVVVESEQVARELAESRVRIARERQSTTYQSGLMDSVSTLFSGAPRKELRNLCVVIKADVVGSAEALARSLSELNLENEEAIVKIKVILAEAGDVTKTDVAIASVTPGTTIIAFNTAATMAAMDDARTMGVKIEYHNIVYDAIESIESRMQEVLSPTPEGEYVGSAVVQEVFNIGGTGNIAGSRCLDGFVKKGSNVRIMRGDKILAESKVKSLRNFKVSTSLCLRCSCFLLYPVLFIAQIHPIQYFQTTRLR